jgi:hypothetical protein
VTKDVSDPTRPISALARPGTHCRVAVRECDSFGSEAPGPGRYAPISVVAGLGAARPPRRASDAPGYHVSREHPGRGEYRNHAKAIALAATQGERRGK